MGKKIIHVDMDCFYAAVEVRDRPELAGKPVAVGGTPDGRGVIATANYEARRFGVRSAMASSRALRLCPSLILVPPNFSKYKTESRRVRNIFERFTPIIQPLSLDEAYLDVSEATQFGGSATRIADEIRRLIREETQLTASAGVAPNKFLAKVASEWNKPDGIKVIRPQDVPGLMPGLKVEKIFGVGKVTAARMHAMGIHTCGDLQKLSVPELVTRFGTWGPRLHELAFGVDTRPVETTSERKSLSVEETFRLDLPDLEACRRELPAIYEEWLRRMERAALQEKIRSIFVKLKFFDFKQTTHEMAYDTVGDMSPEAPLGVSCSRFPTVLDFERLLEGAFVRRAVPVRLIGLGARLEAESDSTTSQGQLTFNL